jgi:hypothetical protein
MPLKREALRGKRRTSPNETGVVSQKLFTKIKANMTSVLSR